MTNQVIQAALTKYANKDLTTARNEGTMAIYDTKLGVIEITYEKMIYTIRSMVNGTELAKGPAKVAREFLIATYNVVQ